MKAKDLYKRLLFSFYFHFLVIQFSSVLERSLVIVEGCEGRVFRWEREVFFLVIQFPSWICEGRVLRWEREVFFLVIQFTSWISIWRLWRPSFQMRKRSLLLGDSISKLNLNLKAVKAKHFIFFLLSLLGDSIFKCFREMFSYRGRLWRPSF